MKSDLTKKDWLIIAIAMLALIGIAIITFNQAGAFNNIEIVSGTVCYMNIEGGFWGIAGDDGKRYEPIHLPTELRKSGLKAEFIMIILKNSFSIRMWGTLVEILEYKIIH